ncbi:MAG TPA: PQQ-binding-like beta-propeller repeat protein [Kiritimatiellia bacterium]|nr:PQQ-binding-like beta-propeller repeat protein [Kiritimatiellia bacterium]
MACKGMVERNRTLRQCARGVGVVALVFSLTVATLLAVDASRVGPVETVRSEVLAQALAQSRAETATPQTVAFARELDRLARRAYFNSLSFRQQGMALLVLGLLLTAGSFGVACRLSLRIPDPRALSGEDPARADRWAVNAVLAAGALLLMTTAAMQVRQGRQPGGGTADRALRASLINPALKPGETHVCPCRRGTSQAALAAQWPFLRGPEMSGRTTLTNLPLAWNGMTGHNIRWKSKLTRGGSSTPVVWGNRLFLTTGDSQTRSVMAYDTATGGLLWSRDVPDGAKGGEPLPETSEDTGLAASTPACDESRVYAIFASGDLAALDHDGQIVWQLYLGRPHNTYGHASSLVYCGEMLIVQWDQEERSRILAIDKTSGRTLWETPREAGMSWSTPLIMPLCDSYVLLVHASGQTWGMELATGKKLWQVEAVTGEIAPSLAWEKDVWLAANCYSRMVAYRMPQQGEPQQLWEWDEGNLPDVASPVILDGLVFLVTDAGEVLCHDLADGKQLWYKEFEDGFYASPVAAEGRVYIVDRKKGVFRVYGATREVKELAVNPMGEAVSATPIIAGGQLFVRGHDHLWCIGAGAP